MPKIFIRTVLFYGMALGCMSLQGCTRILWAPFRQDTVKFQAIHRTDNDAVLTYFTEDGGYNKIRYYYAMPLDEFFSTFSYNGDGKTINEILANLAARPEVTEPIAKHLFTRNMYDTGKGSSFHSYPFLNVSNTPRYICFMAVRTYPIPNSNTVLVPYWKLHSERQTDTEITNLFERNDRVAQLDPSIHFLILPSEQPRFKDEHFNENISTICLTPLTVAADIVLSPIYAIIGVTYIFTEYVFPSRSQNSPGNRDAR